MSISRYKPAAQPRIEAAQADFGKLLQGASTDAPDVGVLTKKLVQLGDQHKLTAGGLGITVNKMYQQLGLDHVSTQFHAALDEATRRAVTTLHSRAQAKLYQVFRDLMVDETFTEAALNQR